MPAVDETIWDQKKLHVLFAVTSVILVFSTIWLFWKDHDREWKRYQKAARAIDIQVTEWRQLENQTDAVVKAIQKAQASWMLRTPVRRMDQRVSYSLLLP